MLSKLFRGSIDFVKGCAGSVGNEKEDVLLLGDDVVNQTIPLILCAEEDVEGNHGASIGELDEKTLFYLMSRGIYEGSSRGYDSRSQTRKPLQLRFRFPRSENRSEKYLEEQHARVITEDFPLLRNSSIAYLDNAATAQRPRGGAEGGTGIL